MLIIPQNTINKLERLKKIDAIIVHHSEGSYGNAEFINDMHIKEKGYSCIGYHFVICNGNGGEDGEIQNGRPVYFWGAQAKGHNNHTLGICLVGNFMNKEPSTMQVDSLVKTIQALKLVYGPLAVKGHRDYCNTLCPGDKLYNIVTRRL